MIPIKELDAICEPQTAGGVSVFGHTQVADTFLAWCNMSRQERRVLAGKMAAYDAAAADEFAMMILSAGVERYKRIWRKIQSAMTVADEETELANERRVEQSNQTALADEEDYDDAMQRHRMLASAQ